MNLRKLAKGKPCLIRVPQVCMSGDGSTVLCHVRLIGISGAGLKAPDILGAFGCRACHSVVDGQTKSEFTAEQRRLMLLEGCARTIDWLVSEGFVTW